MIRLIYFGTADFAVPPLQELLNHADTFQVLAVVSQPDRPAGRKGELTASAVSAWARQNDLHLLQPENLKSDAVMNELRGFDADVFVVAAYGQILPATLLSIPKFGCVNLHGSLLPKYRGASPIQAAILDGEKRTGVTLMLMDDKLDHGPMLATTHEDIRDDDDYESLSGRLSESAAGLLADNLPLYVSGELRPKEQDHERATVTRILKKEDGRVDWTAEDAFRIERKTRAYRPWPGTHAELETKNGPIRVKILKAEALPDGGLTPGTIVPSGDGLPLVGTARGTLKLLELQPEGKRPMSGTDFLRGYANT